MVQVDLSPPRHLLSSHHRLLYIEIREPFTRKVYEKEAARNTSTYVSSEYTLVCTWRMGRGTHTHFPYLPTCQTRIPTWQRPGTCNVSTATSEWLHFSDNVPNVPSYDVGLSVIRLVITDSWKATNALAPVYDFGHKSTNIYILKYIIKQTNKSQQIVLKIFLN